MKPLKNLVSALFRLEKGRTAEQLLEVVTSLLHYKIHAADSEMLSIWGKRILTFQALEEVL